MDPWVDRLTTLAIGAAGGAVTALVALRTRLALMDVRMTQQDRAIAAAAESVKELGKRLEAKQLLQLQLIASIARKLHVDGRFDDLIVRLISGQDVHDDGGSNG